MFELVASLALAAEWSPWPWPTLSESDALAVALLKHHQHRRRAVRNGAEEGRQHRKADSSIDHGRVAEGWRMMHEQINQQRCRPSCAHVRRMVCWLLSVFACVCSCDSCLVCCRFDP